MPFALLRHGGEEKPVRVFAVGLQAPIVELVREGLLEGPLPDRQHPSGMTWWIQCTGYLLEGMGGSPAEQVTPQWDGLLSPIYRVPQVLVRGFQVG